MLHGMSRIPEQPLDNNIEFIRCQRGLSRKLLADMVGVHYQTIGYLERGEYSPSLVLAFRIAQVLDTPLEELFVVPKHTERANS
jgi:DNA-binding XRE family transcriptional regulator